jgi:hypothetical protein
MELPIVCTLTEQQMRERRLKVLEPMRAAAITSEALPDGFAYTFEPQDGLIVQLAQLVDLERQCCRFLTFRIIASDETLRLEITGPRGAQEVIANFFSYGKLPS